MNILLIIRSEIIAIFILVFFLIYNQVCARYREGKDYFRGLALASLGHAVLGLVTEITVNMEGFPVLWNNIFHIAFFTCALLFSLKYFEYVMSLIFPDHRAKLYLGIGYAISYLCIVVMVFSPIQYLQGNGTKYSAGMGPTLCYALGFILMLLSDILLVVYRNKINIQTFILLIPLSLLTLVFLLIQILIPEFLFTGCALAITNVGVFFAIENPIGKFQSRSFMDFDTQLWSKNSYDFDMENVFAKKKDHSGLVYVLADINGLKAVNDHLGHQEGDALIKLCADALVVSMKQAYKIYRTGGDEFAAVYRDIPMENVKEEIAAVHRYCEENSRTQRFTASISIGAVQGESGEQIEDIAKRADTAMYQEKDAYYKKKGIERRK